MWTTYVLCRVEDFVNCWFNEKSHQCLNPRHRRSGLWLGSFGASYQGMA